jgi:hypothetical protein
MASDNDLLTLLHKIKQGAPSVFRFEYSDFDQRDSPASSAEKCYTQKQWLGCAHLFRPRYRHFLHGGATNSSVCGFH